MTIEEVKTILNLKEIIMDELTKDEILKLGEEGICTLITHIINNPF